MQPFFIPLYIGASELRQLDGVSRKHFHDFVDIIFCMDVQVDRLGKVESENTHDRFCINDISSGYEIKIITEFCDIIYERLYFIN